MEQNFVFISDSPSAYVNMARDEWFLDHVSEDLLILHFYQNDNAVIIGKNQNPWLECDLAAMERDGVQLARRVSGGGAVYHDGGNLNFSFICGKRRADKEACLSLIEKAVTQLGIPCERSGRNDMLLDGKKFSGNASADRKGALLFHGTLLVSSDLERLSSYLTVDPKKIASKGISSVRSRVCNLSEYEKDLTVRDLQKAILKTFGERDGYYGEWAFSASEKKEIESYEARHSSHDWRLGQTPKFDLEWKERLSYGGVQLLFSFEKGRISKISAYSDAMATDICQLIEAKLTDLPFDDDAVKEALMTSERPELCELAQFSFFTTK